MAKVFPATSELSDRLFIREAIRNNVGVFRYCDEGIDRAILKQQCEIPCAIFGMFAGENGRTDKQQTIEFPHISRDSQYYMCRRYLPSILSYDLYSTIINKMLKYVNGLMHSDTSLFMMQFIVVLAYVKKK